MNLPSVKDLPVAGKRVLLRADYDVPLRVRVRDRAIEVTDESRIVESLPTIRDLLKRKAKVIIISHLGRPGGEVAPGLSLGPVADCLILKIKYKKSKTHIKNKIFSGFGLSESLYLLENIRFYPGEETNDPEFAKKLASLADFYVNDAFAVSHRQHASIVGIPKFLPADRCAFGFDFLEEIENLLPLRENPKRPVVVILGGVKEDKLAYLKELIGWADGILIGGKLPEIIQNSEFRIQNSKIAIAKLTKEGLDINRESIKRFKKIISKAGTIVWAGPMGVYEGKEQERGTREIAEAVVESGAYAVVGGGDTEAALTKFGLVDKIDYVSSGGGAMLEFLAKGTLAGIEAL